MFPQVYRIALLGNRSAACGVYTGEKALLKGYGYASLAAFAADCRTPVRVRVVYPRIEPRCGRSHRVADANYSPGARAYRPVSRSVGSDSTRVVSDYTAF